MAYKIKALPPKSFTTSDYNYSRWGVMIPNKYIEIKKLKDFFGKSKLSEEVIKKEIDKDKRIDLVDLSIVVEKKSTPATRLEKNTKKDDAKRKLKKEIEEFNEEKEKALSTPSKKDDEIVKKKEKELNKKIKESKA